MARISSAVDSVYTIPCARAAVARDAPAVCLLRDLGLEEDVRDRDVRACTCERECVGATEPARAAGDERDAAGKVDLERHRAILRC